LYFERLNPQGNDKAIFIAAAAIAVCCAGGAAMDADIESGRA
jgi:hypothetical protein